MERLYTNSLFYLRIYQKGSNKTTKNLSGIIFEILTACLHKTVGENFKNAILWEIDVNSHQSFSASCLILAYLLGIILFLKMETVFSSETSVNVYGTTPQHIPEHVTSNS
jgi:hypothetical protein